MSQGIQFLSFFPKKSEELSLPDRVWYYKPDLILKDEKNFFDPHSTRISQDFPVGKSVVSYALEAPQDCFEVDAFHSAIVLEAATPPPHADGMYLLNKSGKMILSTADCLSVTVSATIEDFSFVALVHAGWRGLTEGMITNTLHILFSEGTKRGISQETLLKETFFHIGAGIFGTHYELDVSSLFSNYKDNISKLPRFDEVLFEESLNRPYCLNPMDSKLITPHENASSKKIYPDLQCLALCEILAYGFSNITILRENTYEHPFFASYRAATRNEKNTKKRHFTCVSYST